MITKLISVTNVYAIRQYYQETIARRTARQCVIGILLITMVDTLPCGAVEKVNYFKFHVAQAFQPVIETIEIQPQAGKPVLRILLRKRLFQQPRAVLRCVVYQYET